MYKRQYLLFLNNDVEIITENWLEEMLQLCQQKDVGMAGAKLYYPDDTIQHAGVVVGLGGVAAHVLCKLPRDAEGYMGRLRCVQEISAVTAADVYKRQPLKIFRVRKSQVPIPCMKMQR